MNKKHVRNALLGVLVGAIAGLIIFAIVWTCMPKTVEAAEFTGAALPWVAIGLLLATSVASMSRKKEDKDQ